MLQFSVVNIVILLIKRQYFSRCFIKVLDNHKNLMYENVCQTQNYFFLISEKESAKNIFALVNEFISV